jgi:hypothetical protein
MERGLSPYYASLNKVEGRTYCILISKDDDEFFRLLYPNFWKIESEQERARVERACLEACCNTKVAKVFPVRDNVWATIEIFCLPVESFKLVFKRCLSALRAAVGTFAEQMK